MKASPTLSSASKASFKAWAAGTRESRYSLGSGACCNRITSAKASTAKSDTNLQPISCKPSNLILAGETSQKQSKAKHYLNRTFPSPHLHCIPIRLHTITIVDMIHSYPHYVPLNCIQSPNKHHINAYHPTFSLVLLHSQFELYGNSKYPLVLQHSHIFMKNHNCSMVNHLQMGQFHPFSIAMLKNPRANSIYQFHSIPYTKKTISISILSILYINTMSNHLKFDISIS